jgi:hypothetical protein
VERYRLRALLANRSFREFLCGRVEIQFRPAADMHLAFFIDSVETSVLSLKELGLAEGGRDQTRNLVVYGLHNRDYGGLSDKRAFSRLLGKRLISPPLTTVRTIGQPRLPGGGERELFYYSFYRGGNR